ncbi:MAG: septum formation inhibitor Maf [Halioglobus sp.]|nr:septum formation inhibitor Maf [Halioglobus sp.]
MGAPRLILASASPRRRDLLDQLGATYTSEPAHIDESQRQGEPPRAYVQRMAREKAQAVALRFPAPDHLVLAADTTVVRDDTVLGKPRDRDEAMAILASLSGRWHTVLTAICLLGEGGMACEVVATRVEFATLTRADCEAYLATDEPWDKAGAYGIQGLGGAFVRAIEGSYTNVVGLPLWETWRLLCARGITTALNPAEPAGTVGADR